MVSVSDGFIYTVVTCVQSLLKFHFCNSRVQYSIYRQKMMLHMYICINMCIYMFVDYDVYISIYIHIFTYIYILILACFHHAL